VKCKIKSPVPGWVWFFFFNHYYHPFKWTAINGVPVKHLVSLIWRLTDSSPCQSTPSALPHWITLELLSFSFSRWRSLSPALPPSLPLSLSLPPSLCLTHSLTHSLSCLFRRGFRVDEGAEVLCHPSAVSGWDPAPSLSAHRCSLIPSPFLNVLQFVFVL
jgi:hypothetical protein